MTRFRGGDVVKLDNERGWIKAELFNLAKGGESYYVQLDNGDLRRGVTADQLTLVSHGAHSYWSPTVGEPGYKRGHCSRCGIAKREHPA